jgi:hypothetical protein
MFLGAFAGLLVASFFLIFIDSGDMDGWVRLPCLREVLGLV